MGGNEKQLHYEEVFGKSDQLSVPVEDHIKEVDVIISMDDYNAIDKSKREGFDVVECQFAPILLPLLEE
jgi:hypothetical protein